MPSLSLSKSSVLKGWQCEKALWLLKNRPELRPAVSPSLQAVFDQGIEVGKLAHQLYPEGVHISAKYNQVKEALAQTKDEIEKGTPSIFEAAAKSSNCLIRADILSKPKKASKQWDLIEVKSTTHLEEIHIYDLAIQWIVLTESGVNLNKSFLMHINSGYVRRGELDPSGLFTKEDVTSEVKNILKEVGELINQFNQLIKKESPPEISIGPHCSKPYDCEFKDHCWDGLSDDSIYYSGLGWKKIAALGALGISSINDIPDDFNLTDLQALKIDVASNKKISINKQEIKKHLSRLTEPLYFLDFETIGSAIPAYDGVSPYQAIPFQFSLRIYEKNNEIEHVEFLGDPKKDPRKELAELLINKIGSKGSVVAYNAGFEAGVIKKLAESFPGLSDDLLGINERLWDLIIPFSKRHYMHYEFDGSASLKAVLPVLVPEMSYEVLNVHEGSQASKLYLDLMTGEIPEDKVKKIRADLLEYCGQDTLAMVKILDCLKDAVA